jgi:hypothetical protein
MCYEERETIEHMWNGCSEMRRGGERSGEKEIQKEDGRETGRMKEVWKRRQRMERERGGGQKLKLFFFGNFLKLLLLLYTRKQTR